MQGALHCAVLLHPGFWKVAEETAHLSVRLESTGLLAELECTAMQTFYPQRNVCHISQHPRLLALDKLVSHVKHSFTVGRQKL